MGSICCKSKPYQPFTTIYNSPAKSPMLQKLQKNSPVTFKYTCENCNKKYIFKSKYPNYCSGECYWSCNL